MNGGSCGGCATVGVAVPPPGAAAAAARLAAQWRRTAASSPGLLASPEPLPTRRALHAALDAAATPPPAAPDRRVTAVMAPTPGASLTVPPAPAVGDAVFPAVAVAGNGGSAPTSASGVGVSVSASPTLAAFASCGGFQRGGSPGTRLRISIAGGSGNGVERGRSGALELSMPGCSTWVAVSGTASPARRPPAPAGVSGTAAAGASFTVPAAVPAQPPAPQSHQQQLLQRPVLQHSRSSPSPHRRQRKSGAGTSVSASPPAGGDVCRATASVPSGATGSPGRPRSVAACGCGGSPWKAESVASSWGATCRSMPGNSAWVPVSPSGTPAQWQHGSSLTATPVACASGSTPRCQRKSGTSETFSPRRTVARSWSCGSPGAAALGMAPSPRPGGACATQRHSDLGSPGAPCNRQLPWTATTAATTVPSDLATSAGPSPAAAVAAAAAAAAASAASASSAIPSTPMSPPLPSHRPHSPIASGHRTLSPPMPIRTERRRTSPPTCMHEEGSGFGEGRVQVAVLGDSSPKAELQRAMPNGFTRGRLRDCAHSSSLGPGGPPSAARSGTGYDPKFWQDMLGVMQRVEETLAPSTSGESDCDSPPDLFHRAKLEGLEEGKLRSALGSVGSTATSSPIGFEMSGAGDCGARVESSPGRAAASAGPFSQSPCETPPRRGHRAGIGGPVTAAAAAVAAAAAAAAAVAAAAAPSSPTRSDIEAALESMPTPPSNEVGSSPLYGSPSSPASRHAGQRSSSPVSPPPLPVAWERQVPHLPHCEAVPAVAVGVQLRRQTAAPAITELGHLQHLPQPRQQQARPQSLAQSRVPAASAPALNTPASEPGLSSTPCSTPSSVRRGSSLADARSKFKQKVGALQRSDGFRDSLLQKLNSIGWSPLPSPATALSPTSTTLCATSPASLAGISSSTPLLPPAGVAQPPLSRRSAGSPLSSPQRSSLRARGSSAIPPTAGSEERRLRGSGYGAQRGSVDSGRLSRSTIDDGLLSPGPAGAAEPPPATEGA